MINKANEESEKNIIKTNKDFHNLMENRKKNAEERIKQMKNQALKDLMIIPSFKVLMHLNVLEFSS